MSARPDAGQRRKALMVAFAFSLAAVIGLFLSCSPRDHSFVQWVALVPFFCSLDRAWRGSGWIGVTGMGWIFGWILNGTIFFWIVPALKLFTAVPLPLGALLVAGLCAWSGLLYGLFAAAIPPLRERWPRMWMIPAAFVLSALEFLFPQIFPWRLGCGQAGSIAHLQIASVTGLYGLSFVVVVVNGFFFNGIDRVMAERRFSTAALLKGVPWLGCALLLVFLTAWWGNARVAQMDRDLEVERGRGLRVAMIQGGWRIPEQLAAGTAGTLVRYGALTREAARNPRDLIIWPENVVPLSEGSVAGAEIGALARLAGAPILVGVHYRKASHHFNSAVWFSDDGSLAGRYDKVRLIPFGEFIPCESFLPVLRRLFPEAGRWTPGDGPYIWTVAGRTVSTVICYEAIFPGLVREQVLKGSRLIINLTNDGWYECEDGAAQHLMMASLRSVELGVPLLRATASGISALVDIAGRRQGETPRFKALFWEGEVPAVERATLYRRFGDWFAWMAVAASLGTAAILGFRRRAMRLSGSPDP